jgi:type III secretory pathway component EscS
MSRDRRPSYTFFLMGKEPIQIQHTVIGIAQTNVIILFVAIGDVKGQILIKRIYLMYVCLCIVVSNTYCVVILLCFSSSCVPYVASFSGLSFFDCHSVLLYFMYISCLLIG